MFKTSVANFLVLYKLQISKVSHPVKLWRIGVGENLLGKFVDKRKTKMSSDYTRQDAYHLATCTHRQRHDFVHWQREYAIR